MCQPQQDPKPRGQEVASLSRSASLPCSTQEVEQAFEYVKSLAQ